MITVPIEDIEAMLLAVENFFGPDIFAPMETTEPKTAALNQMGRNLKSLVDKKRNEEKAASEIFNKIEETLLESEIQEFLDDEVHNSSDREGSDVNNSGQEEQILFLVEELGEKEVRRLLNATFDGRLNL